VPVSSTTNNGEAANQDDHSTPNSVLRLASTTSTRDSGLFGVLLPEFEKARNCRVDLIAVGTGAALKLGESGDVDALLVHARSAEEEFMKAGHGVRHEPVMHNFFLIVGPAEDPAQTRGTGAATALKKIADGKHRFLSRGDDSGTHKRELSLWKEAGGRPDWEDYIESGQGMGPTLLMADEKNSYVLTDDGTWISRQKAFRLVPLALEDASLKNPYSVIVVNPDKHPSINTELANAFADFLISEAGQKLIANYQVSGQILFKPDRLSADGLPAETTE
jgi:tungstate transport system substrate-binding protein